MFPLYRSVHSLYLLFFWYIIYLYVTNQGVHYYIVIIIYIILWLLKKLRERKHLFFRAYCICIWSYHFLFFICSCGLVIIQCHFLLYSLFSCTSFCYCQICHISMCYSSNNTIRYVVLCKHSFKICWKKGKYASIPFFSNYLI